MKKATAARKGERLCALGLLIALVGFMVAYFDRESPTGMVFILGQVIAYGGGAVFLVGFAQILFLLLHKESNQQDRHDRH